MWILIKKGDEIMTKFIPPIFRKTTIFLPPEVY